MSIDPIELLALPPSEKMRLIELLWEDLGQSDATIPLPEWVRDEAIRRREELLADPSRGVTHDETWRRIRSEDG